MISRWLAQQKKDKVSKVTRATVCWHLLNFYSSLAKMFAGVDLDDLRNVKWKVKYCCP